MSASVEMRLIVELEDAANRCLGVPCRSANSKNILKVSDFHVRESAYCEASVAAPEPPFEVDIFKCVKAIAIAAVQEVQNGQAVRIAVSKVMLAGLDGQEWYSRFLRNSPLSVRVQIAARAITWLHRTIEILGPTQVSEWYTPLPMDWSHPSVALMLRGKFDFLTPDGLVAVAPSPSEANDDRVAYLALLAHLSSQAPWPVLSVVHNSSQVERYGPGDLLDRGIAVAVRAASAVSSREVGPAGLARTPAFFTCRSCHWREDCAERERHEASSVVRGGIRLAAPRTA